MSTCGRCADAERSESVQFHYTRKIREVVDCGLKARPAFPLRIPLCPLIRFRRSSRVDACAVMLAPNVFLELVICHAFPWMIAHAFLVDWRRSLAD